MSPVSPNDDLIEPPDIIMGGPARQSLWLEVAAVLCVAVIPNFIGALVSLAESSPWQTRILFHLVLAGTSGCVIYVTLYLMHRSGEPWSFFGLDRPRIYDLMFAVMLLPFPAILWGVFRFIASPRAATAMTDEQVQLTLVEGLFIIVAQLLNGFAEELVIKGYLLTRFQQLTGSRPQSVMLSAILFASYHVYHGPVGFLYVICLGAFTNSVYLIIPRVWPFALQHALFNLIFAL